MRHRLTSAAIVVLVAIGLGACASSIEEQVDERLDDAFEDVPRGYT
jgi:hypothetical protein